MSRICTVLALLLTLLTATFTASAEKDCSASAHTTCHTTEFGLSAQEILAYPAPLVKTLETDQALLYDRRYRRVNTAVDIFDMPDGNIINTLAPGFNFVTLSGGNPADGWAQINRDQWIRADSISSANVSGFSGLLLDEPTPYPIGWLLTNTRPSYLPGDEPFEEDAIIPRYTVVNLYTFVEIDDWRWYQVGIDQWVEQKSIAKVLPVERPDTVDTHRWISVDLYEQVAIAYEDTTPVFATLISSGLPQWSTNEGSFHIYRHHQRITMSGAHGQPDFYYLEEVPWTMFFDKDIALHGTYWHDGFGYRRSHGCVNLSITDAHWLYNWALHEYDTTIPNDLGAAVYVYSSGTYTNKYGDRNQ